MDFIPLSIENQNTPNTVEEVLVVGMVLGLKEKLTYVK